MTANKSKIFERDGYQLKVEQHGIGSKLLIIGSVDYYKRVILCVVDWPDMRNLI